MTVLHVTVPIACFRKGMAREYLETEPLPPPATCYGMLLSLVGETDRRRHIGARVSAGLLNATETSVVLRTVWRVKSKPLGASGNTRPDYQQLLTGATAQEPFINLIIHLDSTAETDESLSLEKRVRTALDPLHRSTINRYGGLSLGESTHMVDSVSMTDTKSFKSHKFESQRVFLLDPEGMMSLPVWVDHVGSIGTRHAVGNLMEVPIGAEIRADQLPRIDPN